MSRQIPVAVSFCVDPNVGFNATLSHNPNPLRLDGYLAFRLITIRND
jgi:hypothetical protein